MPASSAWRRSRAIVTLTAAACTVGALFLAPAATAQTGHMQQKLPPVSVRENHAADVAINHIGAPYVYGAAGPRAFDCSGLTMFSYKASRLSLPRTAAAQYSAVRHIAKVHLERGDLVFFHTSWGHVYHAGIFLYWNQYRKAVIIHAPYPGRVVHREQVWTSAWYAGTRRPAP